MTSAVEFEHLAVKDEVFDLEGGAVTEGVEGESTVFARGRVALIGGAKGDDVQSVKRGQAGEGLKKSMLEN